MDSIFPLWDFLPTFFDTLGHYKERTGRGSFSFIDCEVQFIAQFMQVLHENELEAQRITNLQDLFICTLA